jgi:5S rRNA maturation endonuclease (ribonuclease M5)
MQMSDTEIDVWLKLVSLLDEIDEVADAVIVEGQEDDRTLRHLGIRKPIFRASSSRSQTDLFEDLAKNFRKVIIITDFDREGRSLNRRLTNALEKRGLTVEKALRKRLGKLLGQLSILTIESLTR